MDSDADRGDVDESLTFELLVASGELSEGEVAETRRLFEIEGDQVLEQEPSGAMSEQEQVDVRAKLGAMSIPQKIKAAMFGNSVVRGILIFDPNKIIQEFVLKNPRININEIEAFAKSTSISDHVLRLISNGKEWTRHYPVKSLLVFNPKTPQDLGLKWLRHLNNGDLKRLARSKNVPQLLSVTARKILEAQDKKA